MNERIRELAEQVYGSAHYDDFKFAELIVQESMSQSLHCQGFPDNEGLGCPQDMDPTETKPSDYIKRQFGVAE